MILSDPSRWLHSSCLRTSQYDFPSLRFRVSHRKDIRNITVNWPRASSLIFASLLVLCTSALHARSVDEAKRLQELTTAADVGDAEAEYSLARFLLTSEGDADDKTKALDLMRKAAGKGHADAIGGVGYFYSVGVGVALDEAQAVEWFRKGADKGSAKAQLNLGLMIANGKGVPKDEAEGLRLIDIAANKGQRDALYSQAETYFYGQFGRGMDYGKARAGFQKAAEAGHAGAQNNLGAILRDGLGAEKDESAAIGWFRRAAEQGFAKAQSNLGHLLGVNVEDRARRLEALKWTMLASDRGEITAVKTIEELTPNARPEDLIEARKMARLFQAKREGDGR